MAEKVRLQKVLAQAGIDSRRKCESLILSGRLSVNGVVKRELGTRVDPDNDEILLDGEKVKLEKKHLYAFFKPKQVVSTLSDPQGRTTLKHFVRSLPVRVFPVGRLDFDSIGLLLLTNDGELTAKLLHPRYEIPRTYVSLVRGVLTESAIGRLKKGVRLEDGFAKVKSVSVISNSPWRKYLPKFEGPQSLVEITVSEGRKHFIKRIFKAIGHPVVGLCRTQHGVYRLEGLKPGQIAEIKFS